MTKYQNSKHYDLEERTLKFSKEIIKLAKLLPKSIINIKLTNQIIRSGTSMGANYREANETETKKDFNFRIRICRKEGKETIYWLLLILEANPDCEKMIRPLIQEATQN